jgi:hypothetical protein
MMRVALARRFVREYGGLSKADQLCDAAVEALPSAFGHPHHHAGLGLRALRKSVYECRAGLALRIGFTRHGETLLLLTIGNHDAIRTWLRQNV